MAQLLEEQSREISVVPPESYPIELKPCWQSLHHPYFLASWSQGNVSCSSTLRGHCDNWDMTRAQSGEIKTSSSLVAEAKSVGDGCNHILASVKRPVLSGARHVGVRSP